MGGGGVRVAGASGGGRCQQEDEKVRSFSPITDTHMHSFPLTSHPSVPCSPTPPGRDWPTHHPPQRRDVQQQQVLHVLVRLARQDGGLQRRQCDRGVE